MTVGRHCLCQPRLAHGHEARAIGEREVLVAKLEEQLTRLLEPIAADALPAEPRAAIDLLPPVFSSAQAESESKQRERFVDDEVGRDQGLTGLERTVARRTAACMSRIGVVGAGHPARRVDEQRFHRPYNTESWS